jgi:hypothetical protein
MLAAAKPEARFSSLSLPLTSRIAAEAKDPSAVMRIAMRFSAMLLPTQYPG